MAKTTAMDAVLESIMPGRKEAMAANKCVFCGAAVDLNAFTDSISEKEYAISGLCQKCQDETFGGGE